MDSGKISVLNKDYKKYSEQVKRQIGVVPQDVNLDPFFTAYEYLEFCSGFYGIRNNKKYIDEVLEVLELDQHKNKNGRMLSGGMKRRLMIAKAIVHKPEIIILDEPTAGVDIDLKKKLWDYMKILNKEGKTIVITTHYLEEVEELCDRIAIIKSGEVIKSDTKENLKSIIDKKFISMSFDKNVDFSHKINIENEEIIFTKSGERTLVSNINFKQSNPYFINKIAEKFLEGGFCVVDFSIQNAKIEDVFREVVK